MLSYCYCEGEVDTGDFVEQGEFLVCCCQHFWLGTTMLCGFGDGTGVFSKTTWNRCNERTDEREMIALAILILDRFSACVMDCGHFFGEGETGRPSVKNEFDSVMTEDLMV